MLQGIVEVPAEFLYKEMTDGLEQMSSWNPTILECKVLKVRLYHIHTALLLNVTVHLTVCYCYRMSTLTPP